MEEMEKFGSEWITFVKADLSLSGSRLEPLFN